MTESENKVIDRLIELLTAKKEEKRISWDGSFATTSFKHHDLNRLNLNGIMLNLINDINCYTIQEPPQYRPLSDLSGLVGQVLLTKDDKNKFIVTGFDRHTNRLNINNSWWTANDIFEMFTYLDGSPIGDKI